MCNKPLLFYFYLPDASINFCLCFPQLEKLFNIAFVSQQDCILSHFLFFLDTCPGPRRFPTNEKLFKTAIVPYRSLLLHIYFAFTTHVAGRQHLFQINLFLLHGSEN